jgi:DNA-binding CsgD family transcriptional regulator
VVGTSIPESDRVLCILSDVAETDQVRSLAVERGWLVLPVSNLAEVRRLFWGRGVTPERPFAVFVNLASGVADEVNTVCPPAPLVLASDALSVTPALVAIRGAADAILVRPWSRLALTEAFRRLERSFDRFAASVHFGAKVGRLTPRENEVFDLLMRGCSTKTAARELGVSVKTAHVHRANILTKFEVNSIEQVFALRFATMLDGCWSPWLPSGVQPDPSEV